MMKNQKTEEAQTSQKATRSAIGSVNEDVIQTVS